MDKGIGFNRNIKLEWLDATAAFCAEMDDPAAIRQRLKPILGEDREGSEAIRKSIDILLNIWHKIQEEHPDLHAQAIRLYQKSTHSQDRIWLHYGLTMLYYPFFRQCTTAIGLLSRYEETITNKGVIEKMIGELGHLGSLERAAQRVVASLRDWGILTDSDLSYAYTPQYRVFQASTQELEQWFLACTLKSHPAEQLPFADLLHLPALFPFQFTVSVYDLRRADAFEVQRQGLGFDMVRTI